MSLRLPFLDHLGVGTRMTLLSGIALAAIAAAAVLFGLADRRLEKALEDHAESVRIQEFTHEIEAGIAGLKSQQAAFLVSGEAATAEAYARNSARLLAVLESLGEIARAGEIRNHIDTLRDGIADHAESFGKLADLENKDLPGRARALEAEVSETSLRVEARLGEPGLEALAAATLALRPLEQRFLSGDGGALVELTQYRRDVFDPALIEAPLTARERADITALMDRHFTALAELGKWRAEEKDIFARLDEILDYLAPAVDALAGFRREAAARLLEAEESRKTGRDVMLVGAWAVFLAFGLIAIFVVSGIVRPLRGLALAARELSDGNLTAFVPADVSSDELIDISAGLRGLRDQLAEADLRARTHDTRERAQDLRVKAAQRVLAHEMEDEILELCDALNTASAELTHLAATAGEAASETGRRARDITAASAETTQNLRELAKAASGLYESVHTVHSELSGLAAAANGANGTNGANGGGAETALAKVIADLRAYLGRIGGIALRTRLMALNGIMESVRLGTDETGLGFEDIATEIRDLTARITGGEADFDSRIADAVVPLTGIADAVDSQGRATRDILQSAEGAVAGSLELSNAVSRITRAAGETDRVAGQMLTAAQAAATQSKRLRDNIGDILSRMKS